MKVGQHCFNDYGALSFVVARPNPWEPFQWADQLLDPTAYPAAALVPHVIFASPAAWLHAPLLGLFGYLLALTIAVFTPAVWASRGSRGLERVVVFVALGAAAIPAWVVIDRANSTGFVAPIALAFLVALRRRRWGLVAIMVVLAAMVKPQFAVLAVALFAARQWRMSGIALGGMVISNLVGVPAVVAGFSRNSRTVDPQHPQLQQFVLNACRAVQRVLWEGRPLGYVPDGFLAGPRSLIGAIVLVVVVVCVLALGRRISPVTVGIALQPTPALYPH